MSNPDWSQGYVTDTTYADRFFRELSPVWINYVAALNGVRPRSLDQPFTYLELGCGFGTSAMIHAAAFPRGEFHACDFNPAHVEAASGRAAAFQIGNIAFLQASFQDLLLRGDLPAFDYITLHGVYSWVGPDARHAIRQIISRKLKPGGLVYLSYNCLPGWAVEAPVRKVLLELATEEEGGTQQRAEHALDVLKQLSGSKLRYFTSNPAAVAALDSYSSGPSNYLVHEFLNQTWEPFYSVDVADEMTDIGMSYVGSATLADNHQALVVHEQAAEAVARLKTARQRQLATDFAVDRRFRRDIFVRGDASPQAEAGRYLNAVIIGSMQNPGRISTQAKVPRGAITFQPEFIRDLQILLAQGSITMEHAAAVLAGDTRNTAEIIRNLTFFVAAGALMPFAKVHAHAGAAKAQRPANGIIERILEHIIEQRTELVLPSEIAGNGVPVKPVEALAVTEYLAGSHTVEKLAAQLEKEVYRCGIKPTADGTELSACTQFTNYAHAAAEDAISHLAPNLVRLGLLV
jgi:SAM-dependent methyltransferase